MTYVPEKATLKIARCKQSENADGVYTATIKIPGTVTKPAKSIDGRVISGGRAWFEAPHKDDRVEIHITDEDNIMGAGAGYVVGSYTDNEMVAECRGWWICEHIKYLDIRELVSTGFVDSGFYLKVIATAGDARTTDTFRLNIKWGKR